MRARVARSAVVAVALMTMGTGCGGQPPVLPDGAPSGSPGPTVPADAWGQLAALVATAQDNRYVAGYTLKTKGRLDRTVTVTVAADGSWLVSIPGGILGGTVDVAVASSKNGLFQCVLGTTPGCVQVAGGRLPSRADPRIEHVFTDWLPVLVDRRMALSVAGAPLLPGARGQCFSIEPSSASLAAPVDPGIYCYDATGTLTEAALAMGTLILTGTPAPAPPSIMLPGPVVPGSPAGTAAPPPSPEPSTSASTSAAG